MNTGSYSSPNYIESMLFIWDEALVHFLLFLISDTHIHAHTHSLASDCANSKVTSRRQDSYSKRGLLLSSAKLQEPGGIQ